MSKVTMATAADIIIAPSPGRPEMAGARKDMRAIEGGEPAFAAVLDAEVESLAEPTDSPAAAPSPASAQPLTPALPSATVAEVAMALQVSAPAAPVVAAPAEGASPLPVAPSSRTAEAASNPAPVPPAPVEPAAALAGAALPAPSAAPAAAPVSDAAQAVADTPDTGANTPGATMAAEAPAIAAAVVAAATVPQRPTASSGKEPATKEAAAASAPAVTISDPTAEAVILPQADDGDAVRPAAATLPAPAAEPEAAAAQPVALQSGAAKATAPAAITGAPATEPVPDASPGAKRAAARAEPASSGEPAASSHAKPSSQATAAPTSPSHAPTNATAVQAVAKGAAGLPSPELRADAATAPPVTSTPAVDASAVRGGVGEAGRAVPAHPALQSAPAATMQIYTRFIERFDGRAQRFEVRLDPAELGRVNVRIEVGADKKVHAVLGAHDSAALNDLMRGQRALERALADAGIDLSDGGIQFELSEDSGRGLANGDQRSARTGGEDTHVWRGFSTVEVSLEAGASDPATTHPFTWRPARLDLVA